jgi:hypothetical protein
MSINVKRFFMILVFVIVNLGTFFKTTKMNLYKINY